MGCGASKAPAHAPKDNAPKSLEHLESSTGAPPRTTTAMYADEATLEQPADERESLDSDVGTKPRTTTAMYAQEGSIVEDKKELDERAAEAPRTTTAMYAS